MAIEGGLDIDAKEVEAFFRDASKNVSTRSIETLNDAAFDLRRLWRDMIETDVDRPVSFTTRGSNVIVKPARLGNAIATVKVNDIQDQYLAFMVEGIAKTGDDDGGIVGGKIVHPMDESVLDAHGNFPSSAPRWLAAIRKGKKYPDLFIGKSNSEAPSAVFRRAENSQLELVAVFVDRTREYKKTLPLFERAEEQFSEIIEQLERTVEEVIEE